MSLMDLTLPNLLGYAVTAWLLVIALAHMFAARAHVRALKLAEDQFAQRIMAQFRTRHEAMDTGVDQAMALQVALRAWHSPYPAAVVLRRVLDEPHVARDDLAVTGWIATAIQEVFGTLRTHMEQVYSAAPVAGITGTIAGFLIAAYTFRNTHDQGQLLTSVALALVTTLFAGIAALIERWVLEGTIDPWEVRLFLQAQTVAAQGRTIQRSAACTNANGAVLAKEGGEYAVRSECAGGAATAGTRIRGHHTGERPLRQPAGDAVASGGWTQPADWRPGIQPRPASQAGPGGRGLCRGAWGPAPGVALLPSRYGGSH